MHTSSEVTASIGALQGPKMRFKETCSRTCAYPSGAALTGMPLGLERASEIVAAPLVSSHEYALQQHTRIDKNGGTAMSDSRPAIPQNTPELQAAGTAALPGRAAASGAACSQGLRKRQGRVCTCCTAAAAPQMAMWESNAVQEQGDRD